MSGCAQGGCVRGDSVGSKADLPRLGEAEPRLPRPSVPSPSRKPRRVAERSAVGRGRCGPVPPHSRGGVLGSGQAAARPAMWGPAAAAGGTSWSGGGRFPGTWAWGAGPRGAGRAERARAMAAAGGAEPVC